MQRAGATFSLQRQTFAGDYGYILWSPETAEQVRGQVAKIIDLADQELLDIVRSCEVEQEVLDLLDEPTSR